MAKFHRKQGLASQSFRSLKTLDSFHELYIKQELCEKGMLIQFNKILAIFKVQKNLFFCNIPHDRSYFVSPILHLVFTPDNAFLFLFSNFKIHLQSVHDQGQNSDHNIES